MSLSDAIDPQLLDDLPTGLYHLPNGISVFMDKNIEERWWKDQQWLREEEERLRLEDLKRTREIMRELGMPDPDERDPMLIRIPGMRRVHNHPLLR